MLAFAGGYVDALSYLGLGRVFTANMTGNTVLLGIALAQPDAHAAFRSGLALIGFLAGAALAAWLVQRGPSEHDWPPAVNQALFLEGAVLLALAAGWALSGAPQAPGLQALLILLAAVAMGVQSAAVHRLEAIGITTTYITGMLTRLVTRLMRRRLSVRAEPAAPSLLAAVWLVYLAGAGGGAMVLGRSQAVAFAAAPALVLVAAILSSRRLRAGEP